MRMQAMNLAFLILAAIFLATPTTIQANEDYTCCSCDRGNPPWCHCCNKKPTCQTACQKCECKVKCADSCVRYCNDDDTCCSCHRRDTYCCDKKPTCQQWESTVTCTCPSVPESNDAKPQGVEPEGRKPKSKEEPHPASSSAPK